MPVFAKRPLCLAVSCLLAGLPLSAARAAETPPSTDALRVWLDGSEMAGIASLRLYGRPPVFFTADRVEGRVDERTVAEGKVEMLRGDLRLNAERAVYHEADDLLEATGKVNLLSPRGEVAAPYLRLRLDDMVGYSEQADYRLTGKRKNRFYDPKKTVVRGAQRGSTASMMLNVPNEYGLPTKVEGERVVTGTGHAERVDFVGENQYQLNRATYSTCKPGRQDWYLQADQIQLDYDESVGSASHGTVWFQGAPIFYMPTASFPLDEQRRSGFLYPLFSVSNKTGFDLSVPYYWNIAPNIDATLYPRQMSKRGTQLAGEARYVGFNYQGMLRGEYLPNDEITKQERYAYSFIHRQNLGRGFSVQANWNAVSDDTYWQDLSSHLLNTSQSQLLRQVELDYSPSPWLQTNMIVQRYQTLQLDPTQTITRPYRLEPQLNLLASKPDLGPFDFSMLGQVSRFQHDDKTTFVTGDRYVLYPQLALPIIDPAYQLIPKIGMHVTKYALNRTSDADLTRALPTFTLDGSLNFERETDWFGGKNIQTLEPRLYYVYIPYRDQSNIPLFDTGIADFNFAQIFSENRYAGYDRINDANQLTAALSTRLLDGQTGAERLKLMLGQRYYFSSQRVVLNATETARQTNFSNLVFAASGLLAPKTYADLAWEYNYHDRTSERFAAGVRYQPALGKVLSASYRYTRDPQTGASMIDQIDVAGQWPLTAQWSVVGRYNWSLRDHRQIESIAGVEYNAGCWAARVVMQRLAAVAGSPASSIFLQLELSDFGSIGSNPMTLLRRSIPGYGKLNEMPAGTSFSTP